MLRPGIFFFFFFTFFIHTIRNLLKQQYSKQACTVNVGEDCHGYKRDFSGLPLTLSGCRSAHISVCAQVSLAHQYVKRRATHGGDVIGAPGRAGGVQRRAEPSFG